MTELFEHFDELIFLEFTKIGTYFAYFY
jgi:hypothetical protein